MEVREMSKSVWIGGDLSKGSIGCAVAVEGEAFDRSRKVHTFERTSSGNDALVAWASSVEGLQGICIESTGRLSIQFVLEVGARLPVPVSIVEPSRPRQFAKSLGIKVKNDSVDARVLAQFGLKMVPHPTRLPDRVWRELKECTRLREVLCEERKGHTQRLKDGPESKLVQRELKHQVKSLDTRIKAVEAECERLIEQIPQAAEDKRRAMTIPGVGIQTATILLAELGNLRDYKRNEIVGFAGLYPVDCTSGSSVFKPPHLAKGGGSRLRRVLYMAALSARRHCSQLRIFADRLAQEGKKKKVIIGAVMRKLLLLIRAVVATGRDYDPGYQPAV